jgi:hypothetical protein
VVGCCSPHTLVNEYDAGRGAAQTDEGFPGRPGGCGRTKRMLDRSARHFTEHRWSSSWGQWAIGGLPVQTIKATTHVWKDEARPNYPHDGVKAPESSTLWVL